MKTFVSIATLATVLLCFGLVQGKDTVPPEIEMPGTQPQEVTIESPNRCLNCHEGYETNPRVEPGFGWMGAAMGNAGRDPIFWATLTIAEQDFDGAGDLCIRCHSSGGWMGGRSTPTDGSGLAESDENGIDCDTCHQMTNPDMAEHAGVMNYPFIANQGDSLTPEGAVEAYYGSGMYVLSNDFGKLGPYAEGDAVARHMFTESNFHRDVDFCGTCHDVSNPAVGDLAPNAGIQPEAPDVVNSYDSPPKGFPNLDGPITEKAAFNNPPYAYGIVERTFSEYKSSPLSSTLVDDFGTLPDDLRDPRGALYAAYMASTTNGTRSANYVDDATNPDETSKRYFSCQTCHMSAITGRGCDKKNAPNRLDQPMHDQTGGNYWIAPLIQYQDAQGTLRLGGGLTTAQKAAMDDGALRAGEHLTRAATLNVNGDFVRITNMTGHKLISGYPEGRRMWLNIKWYDANGDEIDEEVGAWGSLQVTIPNPKDGSTFVPWSIKDLDDPRLKVYEVHPAITQEWAATLVSVFPYHENTPVGFDRLTGAVDGTLGDLADGKLGSYAKSFHFALNNYVADDNRIPPWKMSYDKAKKRNSLPVPEDQYGLENEPNDEYEHWDEFDIAVIAPDDAVSADLTLYYQGTSWEYVQFLYKAAETPPAHAGTFLAEEGVNFLDAWVKTGMVPPYVMATASWNPQECNENETLELTCNDGRDNDCNDLIDCDDPNCSTDPSCGDCTLIEFPACFDGLDNDCDGDIDCADRTDCDDSTKITACGVGVCESTGSLACKNGTLEEIIICTPGDPTEPGTELTCADGLDNDCDGLTDSDDEDCQPQTNCADHPDKGSCNNDPACEWVGNPKRGTCQNAEVCDPDETPEVTCTDGVDNDCDGMTDCADTADCGADPACEAMPCDTYSDKNSCQGAGCTWSNKNKVCM